jgi:hypothetical protein
MEKIIRDGKVAVLYSPGFGAGWSTWNLTFPECVFDPEIVEMLEKEVDRYEIAQFAEQKYGDDFYSGGADDLQIVWIPEGTKFIINEYDGSESFRSEASIEWIVA